MLLSSDHNRWAVGTAGATAVAGALYALYVSAAPHGASGGSWPGLAFGIAGSTCMLIAAFLSVRKKFLLWRIGSAQLWMRLHIWAGVLAVPLILFHSGFSLGGPLTTILMLLFTLVSLSGVVGLVLQQAIPRMMTRHLPLETLHSQIHHVNARLALDAYEQVASVTGALAELTEEPAAVAIEERETAGGWKHTRRLPPAPTPVSGSDSLRRFYLEEIRPYLRRTPLRPTTLPDFSRLRLAADAEWRPQVERLARMCEESRQLALQLRWHAWLHNWLLLHAPLGFAMFVLAAVHIYFALWF